ncbi:MAG TPA: hypothetical protein VGG39_28020 [Polyangiaceae bacterium]|jgi:hypothetical protein
MHVLASLRRLVTPLAVAGTLAAGVFVGLVATEKTASAQEVILRPGGARVVPGYGWGHPYAGWRAPVGYGYGYGAYGQPGYGYGVGYGYGHGWDRGGRGWDRGGRGWGHGAARGGGGHGHRR